MTLTRPRKVAFALITVALLLGLLELCARRRVPVVTMHMQGEPGTMQDDPRYHDVVPEVRGWLAARCRLAEEVGVAPEKLKAADDGTVSALDRFDNTTLRVENGYVDINRDGAISAVDDGVMDGTEIDEGIDPSVGSVGGSEQGRRDSNPQPPVLETGALPIELRTSGRRSASTFTSPMARDGIEPPTPRFSVVCSTN